MPSRDRTRVKRSNLGGFPFIVPVFNPWVMYIDYLETTTKWVAWYGVWNVQ